MVDRSIERTIMNNYTINTYNFLHIASRDGNVEVARGLISIGANVNFKSNEFGYTPLHEAAVNGNVEIVKLLISNGADVNSIDKHLDTPLHDAVAKGNIDVVRELLISGADINLENINGDTPLDITSNKEIRKLLKEYRDKPDIKEPGCK